MLRPGERLLAGQQAEEGSSTAPDKGGLLIAVHSVTQVAQGSVKSRWAMRHRFRRRSRPFAASESACRATQPRRTGEPVAVRALSKDSRDRWIRACPRYVPPMGKWREGAVATVAGVMLTIQPLFWEPPVGERFHAHAAVAHRNLHGMRHGQGEQGNVRRWADRGQTLQTESLEATAGFVHSLLR